MIATGDKELLRLEEVRLGGCPGAEPSEPVSFSWELVWVRRGLRRVA